MQERYRIPYDSDPDDEADITAKSWTIQMYQNAEQQHQKPLKFSFRKTETPSFSTASNNSCCTGGSIDNKESSNILKSRSLSVAITWLIFIIQCSRREYVPNAHAINIQSPFQIPNNVDAVALHIRNIRGVIRYHYRYSVWWKH